MREVYPPPPDGSRIREGEGTEGKGGEGKERGGREREREGGWK
ncbi:MAG: hypothetical protein QXJ24_06150 [Thermoplasmatales archaeon]